MNENVMQQIAEDIIKNVGRIENIKTCGPCTTRVRFTLRDESKANLDGLKNIPNTMGFVRTFGQYQVIVGLKVNVEIAKIITDQMAAK